MTIADFTGARENGVRFSSGDTGRALHAIDGIGELIETGRFTVPAIRTFPLDEIATAHHLGEDGHVRAKLVLVIDGDRIQANTPTD